MGEAKRRGEADRWEDSIPIRRVVIVEWLGSSERATGYELSQRIENWNVEKLGVELYKCNSARSVVDAVNATRESVSRAGTPILHFDSHGAEGESGGLAPSDGAPEFLAWRQLSVPLRELNIATRFNLLVVG